MEFGDSDPERYFTQSSSPRNRTFPTFVVLFEDSMTPDEDIFGEVVCDISDKRSWSAVWLRSYGKFR